MAKSYKNNLVLSFPIESVSRKFALRRETAGEKSVLNAGDGTKSVEIPSTKFMGGMVRTRKVMTGIGKIEQFSQQLLFVKKYGRSTGITTDEVRARNLFKRASQGTAHIMKDLMQISYVQLQFNLALNDPNVHPNGVSRKGYDAIRDWVFAVQYAGLKESADYNEDHFPGAPSN